MDGVDSLVDTCSTTFSLYLLYSSMLYPTRPLALLLCSSSTRLSCLYSLASSTIFDSSTILYSSTKTHLTISTCVSTIQDCMSASQLLSPLRLRISLAVWLVTIPPSASYPVARYVACCSIVAIRTYKSDNGLFAIAPNRAFIR